LVLDREGQIGSPRLGQHIDRSAGQITATGNPLDLVVSGIGVLLLRDEGHFVAVRSVSLRRNDDGRLVDARGRTLQQANGGDVVIDGLPVEITSDGTILADGEPGVRVGIFALAEDRDDPLFQAAGLDPAELDEVDEPQLRQGYLEQSNVTLDGEMVDMMQISRTAEGGARLVQVYDELLGRVMTTIGQSGR
jgi:flagellar basal body rod protein FlgG